VLLRWRRRAPTRAATPGPLTCGPCWRACRRGHHQRSVT
jgi:hypothetical protein